MDDIEIQYGRVSANITKITNLGQVTITFSEAMNTTPPQNISKDALLLYIEPAQRRHLGEGFNMSWLNFTWQLEYYW